jgi:hypothetical protein
MKKRILPRAQDLGPLFEGYKEEIDPHLMPLGGEAKPQAIQTKMEFPPHSNPGPNRGSSF